MKKYKKNEKNYTVANAGRCVIRVTQLGFSMGGVNAVMNQRPPCTKVSASTRVFHAQLQKTDNNNNNNTTTYKVP